jgi:hypothetical protein
MKKWMFLVVYFMVLLGAQVQAKAFTLNATAHVDTVWATAYQVTVTLVNNTDTPTSSWTASFTLPQEYSLSSYVSSGTFTASGQNVTVTNLPEEGVIQPGGSTTFGMIINMPRSGNTVISQLQAAANGSLEPPQPSSPLPPPPAGFGLQATAHVDTIWATAYQVTVTLVNNTNTPTSSWMATFTMPQGYSLTSHVASGAFTINGQQVTVGNLPGEGIIQPSGSTTFRMIIEKPSSGSAVINNLQAAANGSPMQPPPNSPPPTAPSPTSPAPISPPPVIGAIENGAWYITWTSWFNGPPFVIPSDVNLLNVFVGELKFGPNGEPTIGSFGNLNPPQLDAFTAYCGAQNPPIAVKVSLGGGGGMYDRCWDRLTESNVQAFAQGMADYCHAHGLVGVDFDYEASGPVSQQILVGSLIKRFKALDPSFQTSLCTNAGFGPNFPWQAIVETILDAATIAPGNCAVDKLYIMSYYNSMEEEQNWILGWSNWVQQNYGFTPARVSVGIDDFDAHAYDPVAFRAWAATMGFSTCHWAFDPARP